MKSERILRRLVPVAFLVAMVSIVSSCSSASDQVCFKGSCFQVEVVKNNEGRVRGLQNREHMDQDKGMLFVFHVSRKHGFWMKDTLIPLDIIWLDYSHRVVHIASQAAPCRSDPCPTYNPASEALYVLEINAGLAGKMGLKTGDRLEFRIK